MTDTLLCFEDLPEGAVFDLGEKTVSRDEVVDFARRFDPQPMHLDEAAGARSLLGGLGASGWHTIAMFMRLLCDGLLLKSDSLGSPGIDEVRWIRPVKPGDRLRARAEVTQARASKSRPGVGIVHFRFVVENQDGDAVMTMNNPILFAMRGAGR